MTAKRYAKKSFFLSWSESNLKNNSLKYEKIKKKQTFEILISIEKKAIFFFKICVLALEEEFSFLNTTKIYAKENSASWSELDWKKKQVSEERKKKRKTNVWSIDLDQKWKKKNPKNACSRMMR